MGRINVLDISVANMIAAGEVVERPASVIKELVENSIDAGATQITVEIKNGGISYMRVTDNGRGIEPDDVGLAFVRHATSKIREASDLEAIGTLGFRGEALCSIAAVSRLTMTSKTANAQSAVRVELEGGEMEDVSEIGAPDGTSIEVRKLFYNTPARMKFMKKDTTEAGYITDMVQKFILANPEISFTYINNGKQLFHSTGDGKLVNAIYTVYGRDYARSLIEVSYGDKALSISGYVGKSTISRPNRTYQSFFVNGRYIKSKSITVALDEAYKNQLMGGRFPFAVININVNPSFVDVNVHPNKTEVKFSDERKVFDTVYWGVKNALYEKPTIPDVTIAEKRDAYKSKLFADKNEGFVQAPITFDDKKTVLHDVSAKTEPKADSVAEIEHKKEQAFSPESTSSENVNAESSVLIPSEDTKNEKVTFVTDTNDSAVAKPNVFRESDTFSYKTSEPYFGTKDKNDSAQYNDSINTVDNSAEDVSESVTAVDIEDENEYESEKKANSEYENYKITGVLFDTYIILECGDKALLIDQHAAHERIKFEQLKRDLQTSGIKTQSLMLPVVVDLAPREAAFAAENKQSLASLGFDADSFGENKYIINGAPLDTPYEEIQDLFTELLEQMMSDKKSIIAQSNERALYTIACKAAIKANKKLSEPEIRALANDVFALDGINTCPHGRPIMISLTKYELEKQFKRVI